MDNPDSRQRISIPRWRQLSASLVIAGYLAVLGHGVGCHALQYRVNAHPLMYFTVWDMFCGWSGWSFRSHIVAEGENGSFYELTPAPWGEYHAFGDLGRQHYDPFNNHATRIAANCLKQTQHEPIRRLYLVEETWSKKFNLPEQLWGSLHEDPKDPRHYFHLYGTYLPDGTPITPQQSFHAKNNATWLADSLQLRSREFPLSN